MSDTKQEYCSVCGEKMDSISQIDSGMCDECKEGFADLSSQEDY
jgi:hypothetical protein